jgi:hypothetical protein
VRIFGAEEMKTLTELPMRKQIDWVAVAAMAEEHGVVVIPLDVLNAQHNNAHASLHRLGYGVRRAETPDGTHIGYRVQKLKEKP